MKIVTPKPFYYFICLFFLTIAYDLPAAENTDAKLLEQAKAWAQKNNKGTAKSEQQDTANVSAISGKIEVSPQLQKKLPSSGVLFVYARSFGQVAGPPAAVVRIPNPKFPQSFSLSQADAMMPGIPFTGPFSVTAKFSPEGDAMQKQGAYLGKSSETQRVALGESDLRIQINEAL